MCQYCLTCAWSWQLGWLGSVDASTEGHIEPECDLPPGTEYRTVPLGQFHSQAWLTPAVLGVVCSTSVMSLLLLVGGMLGRSPANLPLHGVEPLK